MHDFDHLPTIEWNGWKMRDISRRFIIKWLQTKKSKPYWFEHRITGWKSIENVAYDFYGSCDYIWALMIVNNIIHPVNDWLMKEDEVISMASKKYGADHLNDPHHYEYKGLKYTTQSKTLIDARNTKATYGYVIPKDVVDQVVRHHEALGGKVYVGDISVVSNIEYEMGLNEKKRHIKVIYPTLIAKIESEMEKIF